MQRKSRWPRPPRALQGPEPEESDGSEQRLPHASPRGVPPAPDGGPASADDVQDDEQGVAQHCTALSHHVPKPDVPCPSPQRRGGKNGEGDHDDDDDASLPSAMGSNDGELRQQGALSAALLQGGLREVLCDHQRALQEAAERHEAATRLGAEAVLEALGGDLTRLLRGGAAPQQPQPARHGEDRELRPLQPPAGQPVGLARDIHDDDDDDECDDVWELTRRAESPAVPGATPASRPQVGRAGDIHDVRHERTTSPMERVPERRKSVAAFATKAKQLFGAPRSRSFDHDVTTHMDVLGTSSLSDDSMITSQSSISRLKQSFQNNSSLDSFMFTFPARAEAFVQSFYGCGSRKSEPLRRGALAAIVNSMIFNAIGNLVIFVNSAFIIHAANLRVHDDSDSLPLVIAEVLFTGWYVLELVLKLVVHRSYYFTGQDRGFNAVDLMLVLLSVLEVSLWVFGAWGMINLDSSFLRTLRVFKVVKVLRMFRALRMFNEIRLMMECVVESMGSFFWAIALLAFLTALFAILFVQSAGNALHHGDLTASEEEALLIHFGSVKAAMFSLLQAQSGGQDWMAIYSHVTPLGTLAKATFVFYIMLMEIAVMNIVASVYLDKAMQVAKPNLENMMLDKHIQDMQDAKELTDMVSEMDTRNSGRITLRDFMQHMKDDKFRLYFDVRGLNVKDTTMFFKMLSAASKNGDDGEIEEEESVDLKAFVMGCMRLKGVASCMDLYTVSWEIKILRAQQSRFMEWAENFSALPAARSGGGAQAEPARPTVDV